MLRTFLGDTPEENKLIPDESLSNDKLGLAIDLTIDLHNKTPPFENVTYETFPSLTLLLHGATIQCLIMAGLVAQRNYISFSDGGIQESVQNHGPAWQSWIQSLMGMYREETLSLKTSLNMERGFGVIPSPYGNSFDFDL
jgi:hypothetical protein